MITSWNKKIYLQWVNFKVALKKVSPNLLKQNISELVTYIKIESNIFLSKIKNLKATNFELGLFHFNKGALKDAVLRFRIVRFFWPDLVECDYYIGRSYVELMMFDKAKPYIENYLKTDDKKFSDEAIFCENIINNKINKIKAIPNNLVIRYFDLIAPIYNNLDNNSLNNNVQTQLINVVNAVLTIKGKPFGNSYLDIGCGTGAVGKCVRASRSARSIEGIDFSQKMINEALKENFEGTSVYDKISLIDFESFSQNSFEKYEVITACYFLNYYTNLENFVSFCGKNLVEGGIIAIALKTIQTIHDMEFKVESEEFEYNLEFVRKSFESRFELSKEIEVNSSSNERTYCLIFVRR